MSRDSPDKQLERLLVMIPWIIANEGPAVEDVCNRFSIKEAALIADLEMLFMCGLYPFTPDTLIEADIVDGHVWIRYADAFQRPPSFTPEEAVSLVAAASAVAELPGNENNEVLRSALKKLSRALGIEEDDVVDVDLASAPTELLTLLNQAITESLVVELDYYSYGRDVWSRRQLHPYVVFNAEGQWYLCAGAVPAHGDERDPLQTRNFRLDRMQKVALTAASFDPPLVVPDPLVYQARPDDPSIELDLSPEARWVVEQYPVESYFTEPDGHLGVKMRVSETAWIDRLLLRLGNHAKVVAGDIDVATTAERVLRRYQ